MKISWKMQKQVYKCSNHGLNLNNLRLNSKWCDVIIKVEGKEYPAHKNILAANLTHFEAMFNNDLFQESQDGFATMTDMRAEDLEKFIIYAYTGELIITDDNALDLLEIADYLREDEIKDACIVFLSKYLNTDDAIRAYSFATITECLFLKNAAEDLIMKNFEDCSKTHDFLDLDYENLKDILSGENAKAIKSQQLFDGIIRWTMHASENRKNHVDNLLILIDSRRLTTDYVMSYLYKNVASHANESEITKSIMTWYYNRDRSDQAKQQNQQALMIIDKADLNVFQWFDFAQKKWSLVGQGVLKKSYTFCFSNAVVVDDKYYFTRKKGKTGSLEVLNPKTKEIRMLHSSSTILRCSAVCSCGRFIYLCGGRNSDDSISDQILRYDLLTNSVEQPPSMRIKRANASAVFHEGYLYVIGGHSGSSILNSVEKYDPETEKWSSLPSMNRTRSEHAVAVMEGKLYACGGSNTNSVEVYEPLENKWKSIAKLNMRRFQFVLVAHEGKLWAVGGNERSVEFYDPSIDQWLIHSELSSGLKIRDFIGGFITRNHICME